MAGRTSKSGRIKDVKSKLKVRRQADDETDNAAVRPKSISGISGSHSLEPVHHRGDYQHEKITSKVDRRANALYADEDEFRYNMNFHKKGIFLIINNTTFEEDLGLPPRKGTDKDVENLKEQFTKLGFTVATYVNLSYLKMRQIFKAVSDQDHSDHACFGCAILSHGDNMGIFATDTCISIDTLLKPLKGCTTLYGKPKLVFIQSCRGEELDDGNQIEADDAMWQDIEIHKIPSEADILCAFSSAQGYRSFRNAKEGSYFIRELCQVLDKYSTMKDMLWMLTRVNYNLAYEFESQSTKNPDIAGKKQMPSFMSQLTKQLVFYK